jgi:hypothetical protein
MDTPVGEHALPKTLAERVRMFKVLKAQGLDLNEIRYVVETPIEKC